MLRETFCEQIYSVTGTDITWSIEHLELYGYYHNFALSFISKERIFCHLKLQGHILKSLGKWILHAFKTRHFLYFLPLWKNITGKDIETWSLKITCKDAPKYWFMFITKLLDNNIKNSIFIERKTKSSLLKCNYYEAHVRIMQYSMIRVLSFQKISSHLNVHVREMWEKETEYQVEVSSGKIWKKELGVAVFRYTIFTINIHNYYYNHKWRFTLDKRLKLNISFEYIYISINDYYGCYIGNLTIKIYSKLNTTDLIYCGTHSYITSYPQYRNVDIILDIRVWITYEIKLACSVTDPNIIVSSMPSKNRKNKPLWMVYFPQKGAFIAIIHLLVKKIPAHGTGTWCLQWHFNGYIWWPWDSVNVIRRHL